MNEYFYSIEAWIRDHIPDYGGAEYGRLLHVLWDLSNEENS